MNYSTAKKMLKRAEARGYVAYHSGIVCYEGQNGGKNSYGINIDGDGHDGRLFGCPKIIWSTEQFNDSFHTNYK